MDTKPNRNLRIDTLRGLSILLVLLHHFSNTYHLTDSPLAALLGVQTVRTIVANGNYGVVIFFVISGFLITSMSLTRFGSLANISPGIFYRLRAARIFPCLLLALAVIVTLGCLELPSFANDDDGHHFPASFFVLSAGSVLTFWHNILMQTYGYFNYCLNVFWSLSVEETFYLAFPLLCLMTRRNFLMVILAVVLIIAGPIYRDHHQDDDIFFLYANLSCYDAIAMGCLAALATHHVRLSRTLTYPASIAAWAGLLYFYSQGIHQHVMFGPSQIAACAALALICASQAPYPALWNRALLAPLRWLGAHSYELYLFHIIVLGLLRDVFIGKQLPYADKLPWLGFYLLISCVAAAIISRLLSEPANRYLRKRQRIRVAFASFKA